MSEIEKNAKHIWLPYTQMQDHLPQLPVESALGSKIYLRDGRELVDGVASWWSAAHGYGRAEIVLALQEQAAKLPHVMMAGLACEGTYKLAGRLARMTGLERVFFSDSGSTGVEVAMKIAWQYFINIGEKSRRKFISFKNSYHGDTCGAMSLADLQSGMHQKFQDRLAQNYCLDLPKNEEDLAVFEDFVRLHQNEVAAIFVEPMVQCAGGMKFGQARILAEIFRIARRFGVLVVADECAVGFWRLGEEFGCDLIGEKPDLMVLGKALTGGVMTMAATLVREEIFAAFLGDSLDLALMHGPTFMGNALAAAACNASLDLFEKGDYKAKVARIAAILEESLAGLRGADGVVDVRVLGAIGVVETSFDQEKMFALRSYFIEKGVFLRPFAGVIYLMPALTIGESELRELVAAVVGVFA